MPSVRVGGSENLSDAAIRMFCRCIRDGLVSDRPVDVCSGGGVASAGVIASEFSIVMYRGQVSACLISFAVERALLLAYFFRNM